MGDSRGRLSAQQGRRIIVVGVLAWQRSRLGARGAGLVAVLNAAMLVGIVLLYSAGWPIAPTSLGAMAFRTVAWVLLFVVLLRAGRQASSGVGDVAG